MEKLSRVKKYAELRKSIETDNNIDKTLHTEENGALEQEETLKKFDSSIFKKVDIKEDGEYTPVREKKEEPLEQPPVDDTFTNEYLDDFIKEVREYNIRKGTRESDNTQADILYQLNAANRAKRSHYIQEIQDEPQPEEPKKTVLSRDDIALQVQNLLKEEEAPLPESDMRFTKEPVETPAYRAEAEDVEYEEPVLEKAPVVESFQPQPAAVEAVEEYAPQPEQRPQRPAKKIIQPAMMEDAFEDEDEIPVKKDAPQQVVLHKKLLEETQQLRVQMDEYEDELTDLSDGVEKTNKLLNFVLCFLILVLLVIIGFIAYSLWKAGGI